MTLTQEDLQVFKAPFKLNEHEFHLGRAYIQEDAITERIEEVDPNWDTTKPDVSWVEQYGVFQISVSLGVTIKGTTRYGVGSAVTSAQVRTNKDGKEYVTFDNEATKSAATDALKRAARLFGIGRYLLQAPKENQFARWLADLSGGQPANIQRTSPQPEARRVPPQAPAQPVTRRDVLLVEAIKETKEGQKGEIQFYRFKVEGQKSDDYAVSCFCWQFVEWSGLKSLKDASAYDETTGVYTPIHPIKATIEQNGNFWNVVAVERLAS